MRRFDAMSNPDRGPGPDREPGPRPWTGWTVFITLLGFFGVIFAVNGVMIHEAVSTMSGVDTDSAYQAGRMFEHDVALAKAQDARQWHVDATVTPTRSGALLHVTARDAAGLALHDIDASAVFERPTDRRLDRAVDVAPDGPGQFHGDVSIEPGQWDLVIVLSRHGGELFRSKNRILLK
jgi:nitrogen fixation protein FixH